MSNTLPLQDGSLVWGVKYAELVRGVSNISPCFDLAAAKYHVAANNNMATAKTQVAANDLTPQPFTPLPKGA